MKGRKPSSFSSLLDEVARLLSTKKQVLDPQGNFLQRWHKGVLILSVFALALDALFFYIPFVDLSNKCLDLDYKMELSASILRTFIDALYIFHIALRFRVGFIPRATEVFGREDSVNNPFVIARRYLSSYFFVDILAILPVPQVVVLVVIPLLNGPSALLMTKESLKYIIFVQYIPRIVRIYPLYKQAKRTSGILIETVWVGAAFNLFLYMLASHLAGALWYLFSIERQDSCWHGECGRIPECDSMYLYCDVSSPRPIGFIASLNSSCPLINPDEITDSTTFNFGMFVDALRSRVVESKGFGNKIFYCFWWGLRNVSSLGQNLETSTYPAEIAFAVGILIFGLLLFALLIGNLQTYLQSTTVRVRLEEKRLKKRDTELWMSHRMLPNDLKKRIRRYNEYKWQETRGVEEESLVRSLPKELQRDIKRHLCLKLLMRVPLFGYLDDDLIMNTMCDRLKPVLYTEKTTIIREGDPVEEIMFIIRGNILSITTNSNLQFSLKEGDFCGDELLTWALDWNSRCPPDVLPTSTQTVVTLSDVEAFTLVAHDLKSIVSGLSLNHNDKFRRTFRFHSRQWRTWAACYIQVAWSHHCRRKLQKELQDTLTLVNITRKDGTRSSSSTPSLGATICASRFATNVLQAIRPNQVAQNCSQMLTSILPQKSAPEPPPVHTATGSDPLPTTDTCLDIESLQATLDNQKYFSGML